MNRFDALEDNGPYLQMLKFYNDLYRAGLVDPDSMTQTYDQMSAKVKSGGVLFSIFNYSGSLGFNTDAHLKAGKYMYCMKPEEAKPIVYGMNTQGGFILNKVKKYIKNIIPHHRIEATCRFIQNQQFRLT